ncbi:MAG: transcription antitermination factor NusB [Oscillospiraceae bacterium]|jgi:N utilization substance protein B|nr:transcription antitermination factor NusB [Oscillospiraceae bacterium]
MSNRRAAREQAFALLFVMSFRPGEPVGVLADCMAEAAQENEEAPVSAAALELAQTTAAHLEQIDGEIERRLKGWRISRISRVSLALLRMAVCEMLFCDRIPVGASINEAVELAKRYGDEEAARFVNGVLGAIARAADES